MQRIQGPTALPGGQFTEGDPLQPNAPATDVAAAWLNGLQEELAFAIEDAGGTLSPTFAGQLLDTLEGVRIPALGRNVLDNGGFDLAQRGVSRSFPFGSFATLADAVADRWLCDYIDGGATISREEHTPSSPIIGSQHYLRWNQTTGATSSPPMMRQNFDTIDALAGETVTLSYWGRCAGGATITPSFAQHFGTGGSPTATRVISGTAGSHVLGATWTQFQSTFAIPDLSGVTLGSDTSEARLEFRFELPQGPAFDLELDEVQVERGELVSIFDRRTVAEEFARASRYFWKSHALDQDPTVFSANLDNAIQARMLLLTGEPLALGTAHPNGLSFDDLRRELPTALVRLPRVEWWNPINGQSTQIYLETIEASPASAGLSFAGETEPHVGVTTTNTGAPRLSLSALPAANEGKQNRILAHVTLDAEL